MRRRLSEIFSQGIEFEEDILKAFENRQLVFFVGAGVSRIMGVPGWDELSGKLIKKAFPNYNEQKTILRDVPDNKERITIAHKKFENDNNLTEFYEIFGQAMVPDENTFKSKENIYEILNRFNAFFLTTNADNLFEDVLGSAMCHEDYSATILKSAHHRKQNHLFYLHGHYTEDIDLNSNKLVFTAPQYVQRYNDDNFLKFLKAIFDGENTIVFIGYGLNEFELIDYIVTKASHANNPHKKAFILYGFSKDDDILFNAKSDYFESLNIQLIPYNMTEKGYDALIDTLKVLNEHYRKNTIIPLGDFISDCIHEFTPENYTSIVRILDDVEQAHTKEPQIVQEIEQLGDHIWTENFYRDNLYSAEHLEEKVSYRAWPLLELFANWVESNSPGAQDAALLFLNSLNKKQIKLLSNNYSHINTTITRMVLALDKNHIRAKHIDLIYNIFLKHSLFPSELHNATRFKPIQTWNARLLKKLFNHLFRDTDLDDYNDIKAYVLKSFLNTFNEALTNKRVACFVFEFFKNLINEYTFQKEYNLFMHIHSLDNIEKNLQEIWKIVLYELNYSFSQLSPKKQHSYILELISDSNLPSKKLGLYLARKYDHNITLSLLDPSLYSCHEYFHECYLLLKHHVQNNYLDTKTKHSLSDIIYNAYFGLDNLELPSNKMIELDNIILSKRLLLLKLLDNEYTLSKADEGVFANIAPYNSDQIAEECDYVHSRKWVNNIQLSLDSFTKHSLNQWVDIFDAKCQKASTEYSVRDCANQFAQILLNRSQDELDTIIPTLKKLPSLPLVNILQEFHSERDKFVSHHILIDTCLDILDKMVKKTVDNELAKVIFSLISDINPTEISVAKRIVDCIDPWLHISIDGEAALSGDHPLTNLINFGDFYKISAWLNCNITLKKARELIWEEKDSYKLINLLKNDTPNHTIKYSLCYHYQKLKYLSEDHFNIIHTSLLSPQPNTVALLICICNSRFVFKELTELLKETYLSAPLSFKDECKEEMLITLLYNYIISAWNLKYINQKEIEKAFQDHSFIKHYLTHLSSWAKEESFVLEYWIIPCWEYIKRNCNENELHIFIDALLHSLNYLKKPTLEMLSVYTDIISKIKTKTYVYTNISAILSFFEIDVSKADDFICALLDLDLYLKKDNVKQILSKYKEHNLERKAAYILNKLSEKGEISNQEKEQLAKEYL